MRSTTQPTFVDARACGGGNGNGFSVYSSAKHRTPTANFPQMPPFSADSAPAQASPSPFRPSDAGRYRLSFTAGALLPSEMAELARAYERLGDWDGVAKASRAEGLLGYQAAKTAERLGSELIGRLRELDAPLVDRLRICIPEERRMVAWVACCRHYSFVREFATEVVRERFLAGGDSVSRADYLSFFERKEAQHPELASVSESTRDKLRQVLFRMFVDAGILAKGGAIQPVSIPEPLLSLLDRADALCFPVFVREG